MSTEDFPREIDTFNQTFLGYCGQFGTGGGTEIFYLQTALKPVDLEKITLIGDIPGSEAWSVRDLFQRDVDIDRVTKSLLPYFRSADKVKFFNPLTLTVLPFNPDSNQIEGEMPLVTEMSYSDDGTEWRALTMEDVYRYRHPKGRPQYGRLEWNDTRARVVAIDGQHRLSALKRLLADTAKTGPDDRFLGWTIPVVVFSLRALSEQASHKRILDVVRNIFIYINTQARTPNEARQILLSDESVNAICTQELLEHSHQNDVKPIGERDSSIMPLLFYDWRGEEVEGKRQPSPGALQKIEEVRDWLREYVLGADFSDDQKNALAISPTHRLQELFVRKSVDPAAVREVRSTFGTTLLTGLVYLLANFTPYKIYIAKLREIESKWQAAASDDVGRHAFHLLRFGSHRGGPSLESRILAASDDISHEIAEAVSEIPLLIQRDIGGRAVVSAFAELKRYFDRERRSSSSWEEYSRWFTSQLNRAYDAGWLTNSDADRKALRLHVSQDSNDIIVNYRFQDVSNGLGAYTALFCAAYGQKPERLSNKTWEDLFSDMSDRLTATLERGYRKEVRVILKEKYPSPSKELTKAVNEEAKKRTEKHIGRLEQRLREIRA
jgi:hypothetical protein